MSTALDAALAHADAHLDDSVERLKTLVAIKSISTDPAYAGDVRKAADWLAADLAKTTQPFKVVFHHKPAYSSCRPNGEDTNVRNYFVPVSEAAGVQLDLAGHNHNYERTVPLAEGAEVAQADGTIYVVTAGAGAPLYDNNQGYSYTALSVETQHYMVGVVEGDRMTMTAYDLAGNVLDVFTITP